MSLSLINDKTVLFLCIMLTGTINGLMRVAHSVISITAPSLRALSPSIYDLELIGMEKDEPPRTVASEFQSAVQDIVDGRKITPWLYQQGRFPRVLVEGTFSSFVLEPREAKGKDLFGPVGEIEVVEDNVRADLLAQEVATHVIDVHTKNVVLINGGAYHDDTIESLPNNSKSFVLFPPYRRHETVPIFEAKNRIAMRQQTKSNAGVERIPYNLKAV